MHLGHNLCSLRDLRLFLRNYRHNEYFLLENNIILPCNYIQRLKTVYENGIDNNSKEN